MEKIKFFGNTIRQTIDILQGKYPGGEWARIYPELATDYERPPMERSADEQLPHKTRKEKKRIKHKVIMRIIISLVLLLACVFLLIWPHDDVDNTIPSSLLGAIVGYWLS